MKQTVAGAIDLMLRARKGEPEGKAGKGKRPEQKPLEEKESYRWAERAVIGRERLAGVPRATVVQDREGDICESYPLLKEHDVNWVIRASHDRKAKREGGSGRVSEYLAGKEAAGSYRIEAARRGEKKQSVKLEVRFGKIRVEQPAGRTKEEGEKHPGEIEMRVVQAKEKKEGGESGGKKEINWTLYTSHEVETMEDALKAIEYYSGSTL